MLCVALNLEYAVKLLKGWGVVHNLTLEHHQGLIYAVARKKMGGVVVDNRVVVGVELIHTLYYRLNKKKILAIEVAL